MSSETPERDAWLNRIRYRSWHRGCKETDLILGGYCTQHIHDMNDAELTLYEVFLEEDDAEIWSWITGKTTPQKQEYLPLIHKLRAFEVYQHPNQ